MAMYTAKAEWKVLGSIETWTVRIEVFSRLSFSTIIGSLMVGGDSIVGSFFFGDVCDTLGSSNLVDCVQYLSPSSCLLIK